MITNMLLRVADASSPKPQLNEQNPATRGVFVFIRDDFGDPGVSGKHKHCGRTSDTKIADVASLLRISLASKYPKRSSNVWVSYIFILFHGRRPWKCMDY
ncbi:unnamed protein product [Ectocarpus fasciculatus]